MWPGAVIQMRPALGMGMAMTGHFGAACDKSPDPVRAFREKARIE
jgi:hypothetical protein